MKNILKAILFIITFSIHIYSQRENLNGLKFCVDPGHGGNNAANDRRIEPDAGNVFWESEGNYQKALALKSILEAWGAKVFLTRYTNSYPDDTQEPSLSARSTVANSNNVNWFHSIHSNATGGTNTSTNYTLILVKENISTRQAEFSEAVTMSTHIYNNIRKRNRTSAYGVRLDYTFYGGTNGGFNLGVLKGLLMPGELSEGSFHDYYPETRRLMNLKYCRMEAYGIADGFLEYYSVPFDSLADLAGIITSEETVKPQNNSLIELLPTNKKYTTDNFNNGYYLFDSLTHGNYNLVFDLGGNKKDTVSISLQKTEIKFLDKTLPSFAPPFVTYSSPRDGDTSFNVTNVLGVIFSKPMDTTSVKNSFSITPLVSGTTSWTNQNKTFIFKPSQSLNFNSNYIFKIDSSAKSQQGINIDGNSDGTSGDAFVVKFKTMSPPNYVENEPQIPTNFHLFQNYPNPFNPVTTISFEVPRRTKVKLRIFDLLGNELKILLDEEKSQGRHSILFSPLNYSSGIYIANLSTEFGVQNIRMQLLK